MMGYKWAKIYVEEREKRREKEADASRVARLRLANTL
jgi:hypothetical protein